MACLAIRECPQEYQERLEHAGGTNQYGEANYRLGWGECETIRTGGAWPTDNYVGYRQVFAATGSPWKGVACWMLMEWSPARTDEGLFYFLNRDVETGLDMLGQYPSSGTYAPVLHLTENQYENGNLKVRPVEVDSRVVDFLIPIILRAKMVTAQKRAKAAKEDRARAEEKWDKEYGEAYDSAKMAFTGPVSYSGQNNKTSLVTRREDLMDQQARQVNRFAGKRGFMTARS